MTRGVLRLEAENCLGESTGGDPVIDSMDKGEGFGFGPVRGLVGTGLRLKFEDEEDEEDDGDETPDDKIMPVELSKGFDSRIGGGVRGDRGGGEGSGERVLIGERIRGRGDTFLGDIGIGDLDRGRLYSSSLL